MNVSHFGSSAFTYALPELPRHHRLRHRLAWIMQETPQRDCGDGRATGQPSRGTAGLGPEAYLWVRRKVRDPRTSGRTARYAVAAGGSCI